MMQIGVQPLSAAFAEGSRPDPDQAVGGHAGQESQATGDPAGQLSEGLPSVSLPPLPFPRVFPGL
jgi:hypothetical protein